MLPESALYRRKFDGTLHPLNPSDKNLPILTRAKFGRWPCYILQGMESKDCNVFHSVSNILKLTQDNRTIENLRRWEARVGKQEAMHIRNEAIKAGNYIHAYLHSYLTRGTVKPVQKPYELYFKSLKQVLSNFGDSILSEQFIVSFKYQYFGKIDHFGLYRESLTLSDLKTSLKPKLSLDWIQDKVIQLAAYYVLVETLYPIEQAALIYLISDGSSNEFLFSPQQMNFHKELWLKRLSQVKEMAISAA